jgi:hypothetical protein
MSVIKRIGEVSDEGMSMHRRNKGSRRVRKGIKEVRELMV